MSTTIISGLEEIAKYYGRGIPAIRKLIKHENFPARKICGHWESNPELIDAWHKRMLEQASDQPATDQEAA